MDKKYITQHLSDLSDKQRNKYQFLINDKIILLKENINIETSKMNLYKEKIEELYLKIANNINSDMDVNVLLNYNNQISSYKRKRTARFNKTIEIQNEIDFLNDILEIINLKQNFNIPNVAPSFESLFNTQFIEPLVNKPKIRPQKEIINELNDLGVTHQYIKGDEVEYWSVTVIEEFNRNKAEIKQLDYIHFPIAKTHLDNGFNHVEKIYGLLLELFQHNVYNKSLKDNPILWWLNSFEKCLTRGDIHVFINDNDPLSPYVFHKESNQYLNGKGKSLLN